jgi:hypothetical protein
MTKFHSGLKLTWKNSKDCWQNLIGPRGTRVIHALPNNNVIITRLINNPQAKETEGSESQIDLGLFSFLFPSFFLLEGIWFFFWVFDQEKLLRVGEEES